MYTITHVSINNCGKFFCSYAYEACFAVEYEMSPWLMLELDRLYTIYLFRSIRVVSL